MSITKSWRDAESHCEGKNGSVNVNTSLVGEPEHSYWIGLSGLSPNKSNCKNTTIAENGTNVTDFRLSKCSIVQCSDLKFLRYVRCNDELRPPVCIKARSTNGEFNLCKKI